MARMLPRNGAGAARRPTCSQSTATSTMPRPRPPSDSGRSTPNHPWSAMASHSGRSNPPAPGPVSSSEVTLAPGPTNSRTRWVEARPSRRSAAADSSAV